MLQKSARRLVLIIALAGAANAQAYTSEYHLNFGPFVGGGSISDGTSVRHTSGYTLALDRNWQVGSDGLSIGPRVEASNGFVNTRYKDGSQGTRSAATYDNRFVAAGIRISQTVGAPHTFAQGVYMTAVLGKGYSKLNIDDTSDASFTQRSYSKISGNYFGSELGGWVPLKDKFGINIAFTSNIYRAKQQDAVGSYESESPENGGFTLTRGTYDAGANQLSPEVVMKTFAGRIGLSLGF